MPIAECSGYANTRAQLLLRASLSFSYIRDSKADFSAGCLPISAAKINGTAAQRRPSYRGWQFTNARPDIQRAMEHTYVCTYVHMYVCAHGALTIPSSQGVLYTQAMQSCRRNSQLEADFSITEIEKSRSKCGFRAA